MGNEGEARVQVQSVQDAGVSWGGGEIITAQQCSVSSTTSGWLLVFQGQGAVYFQQPNIDVQTDSSFGECFHATRILESYLQQTLAKPHARFLAVNHTPFNMCMAIDTESLVSIRCWTHSQWAQQFRFLRTGVR